MSDPAPSSSSPPEDTPQPSASAPSPPPPSSPLAPRRPPSTLDTETESMMSSSSSAVSTTSSRSESAGPNPRQEATTTTTSQQEGPAFSLSKGDTIMSATSTFTSSPTSTTTSPNSRPTSSPPPADPPFSPVTKSWKSFTARLHHGILAVVVGLATTAARFPRRCIGLISGLSLTVLTIGFFTNFELALDDEVQFAPTQCRPREHYRWFQDQDRYPPATRPLLVVVHRDGHNVMTAAGLDRVFASLERIRHLPGYYDLCRRDSSSSEGADSTTDCRILGPTRYWDHNTTLFHQQLNDSSDRDEQIRQVLSQETFTGDDNNTTNGIPIPAAHSFFMGNLEREQVYVVDVLGEHGAWDNNTTSSTDTGVGELDDITTHEGTIVYAESFIMTLELPDVTFSTTTVSEDGTVLTTQTMTTMEWETLAIDALLEMRQDWDDEWDTEVINTHSGAAELDNNNNNNNDVHFRMEFYAKRSVPDEMARAVASDLPLLPLVFAIMSIFTCLVFARFHHRVHSRALLGIGSVVTILCSIMTGFGLAFIMGFPFTNLTQVLPFVIFGVGLDDTFIITGAYFRTNPKDDTVLRIRQTMEEVGASISLTTITTTLAFVLGLITSSVPTIQWLCLYAFFTIAIDFFYQITFFVACVVLDEERIQANRRDCCICFVVPSDADTVIQNQLEQDVPQKNLEGISESKEGDNIPRLPLAERFMTWYCEILLKKPVKIFVLVAFAAFFAGCAYSATKLTQAFRVEEFLPDESYALGFIDSTDMYSDNKLRVMAFFRDVDQSNPEVQRQMLQYVDDLAAMPQIQKQPDFCWVRDFKALEESYEANPGANPDFDWIFSANLTFAERLNLILLSPDAQNIYGSDIARDDEGNIISSRCIFTVNGVDLNDVYAQIDFLADQRRVTAAQEGNQGKKDFDFFLFDPIYFLWEFYTVAVDELTITTISGILAVAFIAFVLIPHWTASLFVLPMMIILYTDLLGTLQFAGMHINPLVCICLITSIGLLVDFVMHVLLRYYESTAPTREEKVKDTLQTMGASILVGGLSTCLGVIPLAFSTSSIIGTMFVLFVSMITIGVAHGLIFLPVVLSICGPLVCIEGGHDCLHSGNEESDIVSSPPSGSGTGADSGSREEESLSPRSKAVVHQAENTIDWGALTEVEC